MAKDAQMYPVKVLSLLFVRGEKSLDELKKNIPSFSKLPPRLLYSICFHPENYTITHFIV
jgi:hypothetical protein